MSKAWNSSIMFPQDSDYVLRYTDVEFDTSKKGNPMIVLDSEVVDPNEKEVAGEMITVAGVKPNKSYITLRDSKKPDDSEPTDKAKARLKLIIPESAALIDSLDYNNPSQELLNALKGALVFAVVYSKAEPKRKSPTAAQVAAAQEAGEEALGDIMKNPITGEFLNYYKVNVGEVFGPAPKSKAAGKPF